MGDPKPEKPYKLHSVPTPWTETDIQQWRLTLLDYLKSIKQFKGYLNADREWKQKHVANRGFTNIPVSGSNPAVSASDQSDTVDSILLKIATYGPKSIFQDIINRSTSFKYIWNAVRRVAGCPSQGAKLIQYIYVKNSFDPSNTASFNDHYWKMRDIRISCLLSVDSGIKFDGKALEKDEELTPSVECQIVVDWLESIGGAKLVRFVGKEYAKELESNSLFDLQERLGQQDNMQALLDRLDIEDDETKTARVKARYVDTSKFYKKNAKRNKELCQICKETGKKYDNHKTKDCFSLPNNKERWKKSIETRLSKATYSSESTESNDESSVDSSEEERKEKKSKSRRRKIKSSSSD